MTAPQHEGRTPEPGTASAISVGQELVSRLQAFNDRLALGNSFERVTRIRCDACNGAGYVYGHGMCPRCGGNGARERRERIDPMNVRFDSGGCVVVTDRKERKERNAMKAVEYWLVLVNVADARLVISGPLPRAGGFVILPGGLRVVVDETVISRKVAFGRLQNPEAIHLPRTATVDSHGFSSSSRSDSVPT